MQPSHVQLLSAYQCRTRVGALFDSSARRRRLRKPMSAAGDEVEDIALIHADSSESVVSGGSTDVDAGEAERPPKRHCIAVDRPSEPRSAAAADCTARPLAVLEQARLPPLPPGPSSVEEFATWPNALVSRVFASPSGEVGTDTHGNSGSSSNSSGNLVADLQVCLGASASSVLSEASRARMRMSVQAMLSSGIALHTDYAGKQSPEAAMSMLSCALEAIGFQTPLGWCKLWRATDVSPLSLKVIRDGPHRPCHLFPGVQHLLPEKAFEKIRQLRPKGHPRKAEMDKFAAAAAYTKQKHFLARGMPFDWSLKCSQCLLHPGEACPLNWQPCLEAEPCSGDTDAGATCNRRARWNIAGTQCTPFTEFGRRMGLGDPDTESWNIWSSHCGQLRYDVTVLENSKQFPLEEFERTLWPAKVVSIVIGPTALGWPLQRQRLFASAINQDTYIWCGPPSGVGVLAEFMSIFGARVMVDAAFFEGRDTPEQRDKFLREICRTRGTWPQAGGKLSVIELLPPGERRNLQRLQELIARQPSRFVGELGKSVADLSQNPDMRLRCGKLFPPLMKSSKLCVCGPSDAEFLTPSEVNFAHGWASIPVRGNEAFRRASSSLSGLTIAEQQSLSGNAMHLPTFAAWLLYTAANIFPKSAINTLSPQIGPPGQDEGEDSEFDFSQGDSVAP